MIGIIILMIAQSAYADTIISNAASWEDVYSAGVFAALRGDTHKFLVSLSHGEALKKEIPKRGLVVIESDKPYVKNYAQRLKSSGYEADQIRTPDGKANIDLAKRLKVNKYYIVDPSLGYDAISVAPLAIKEKAYVLFATKENIMEVMQVIQTAPKAKITLVGELDPQVESALAQFNPETIKKGSRYKNNVEIAEKVRSAMNSQQAILTNGEFLVDDVFFTGEKLHPIIFIGRQRPPEEVMNYLKSAGFKTTVLIGNDLVGSAKRVKDLLQIPMFVKFGKGMTEVGGVFTGVRGLDLFPVPSLDLLLTLQGVGYNTETGQIELYVKNEKKLRTYLLNSLAVKVDGELIQSLGDDDAQMLSEYEQKGYFYPIDLSRYIGRNMTVEIVTPYGYTKDEMDELIEVELPLGIVSEEDDCELEIIDAGYNPETVGFEIEVQTNGNCFAQAFIKDLRIDNEFTMPQSTIEQIDGTGKLRVKQSMSKIDIADNPEITVEVRYGSRAILTKITQKTFKWKEISSGDDLFALLKTPLGMAMMGIILIMALLLLWKRKK